MIDKPKKEKQLFYNPEIDAEEMILRLSVQAESLGQYLEGEIKQMVIRGMGEEEIIAVLTTDLTEEGRIFSPVRQGFKHSVDTAIEDISQGVLYQASPESNQWEWIVTSSNPCRDCVPRHGEIDSYESWKERGLPRSGFSACRYNCQCVLLPAEIEKTGVEDPVSIKTLPEYRVDFQDKLSKDEGLQQEIEAYKALQREKARAKRKATKEASRQ